MNAATLASKRVRQETMEEETTVEIQEEEPLVIDAETPPDPI
jgi:DNA-directed RNA polymerase subunit K/omega